MRPGFFAPAYRNPVRRKESVMKEQIQKWEDEIEKITERQKEMIERNNVRIRELRKKIQNAEQEMLRENNQMIADTVRDIYGEVSKENLEAFKQLIASMAASRPQTGPEPGSPSGRE